ncbi:MAG: uroporphyrinogen decarboxylase family protein [Planctomycetota bacterium]|jgi:hypothetical protein|nr:uroporphyrinogen decarboxylase family protein [Planctomycetota bacterium]
MTPKQRLDALFDGQEPDRTPILGGWIACPDYICTLAEVSLDEYWSEPIPVSIRAYQKLGMDGLISVFVPRSREDYRCVDISSYAKSRPALTLEESVAQIDEMPSPEQIENDFDFDADYEKFRTDLVDHQAMCGDMVWMPAQWGAGGRVTWYGQFGYENYFMIVGAYPDRAQKLMEIGGAQGRLRCRLTARAIEEGLFPKAVLLGEDICTQRGPMISMAFMEKYYAPQLRYGLEPLLEVGCRPVWHCDGDVRAMLDMLTDCGIQGFQGFQPECGMTIETMAARRTRDGDLPVIFGPISVTTELPVCTPDEIRAKVKHAIEVCEGNAHLALFTANTINPDIPLENILAMYDAVLEGDA